MCKATISCMGKGRGRGEGWLLSTAFIIRFSSFPGVMKSKAHYHLHGRIMALPQIADNCEGGAEERASTRGWVIQLFTVRVQFLSTFTLLPAAPPPPSPLPTHRTPLSIANCKLYPSRPPPPRLPHRPPRLTASSAGCQM